MILFRYGVVGLSLVGLLVFSLIKQMVRSRRRYFAEGTHLGILLSSIYVLSWLVFSFPAGGFLFENPLMYVCIAAVWASPAS
jgi:O-antigen ligase